MKTQQKFQQGKIKITLNQELFKKNYELKYM